ncbi:MAG: transposase [Planctomycetes bacterium]|nr:transposase [Planctomycetota bacterium]
MHPHHAQPNRPAEEDHPEPARHRRLILTWFRARGTISSGVVEGFSGTAKLTTSTAFGFRTPQGIEIALFHVLGQLPEPGFTHRFC